MVRLNSFLIHASCAMVPNSRRVENYIGKECASVFDEENSLKEDQGQMIE